MKPTKIHEAYGIEGVRTLQPGMIFKDAGGLLEILEPGDVITGLGSLGGQGYAYDPELKIDGPHFVKDKNPEGHSEYAWHRLSLKLGASVGKELPS